MYLAMSKMNVIQAIILHILKLIFFFGGGGGGGGGIKKRQLCVFDCTKAFFVIV